VGLALYKTETKELQQEQSKKAIFTELKTSVGGRYGGVRGEAGVGHARRDDHERGSARARGRSDWVVIGGTTANEPESLVKSRNLPKSWRSVHAEEFVSIFQLLPKALRAKVMAISKEFNKACPQEGDSVRVHMPGKKDHNKTGVIESIDPVKYTCRINSNSKAVNMKNYRLSQVKKIKHIRSLPLNGKFRIKSFDRRYLYSDPKRHRGTKKRLMVLLWNGDIEVKDKPDRIWTIRESREDNPDRNKHYITSHDGYHIYRPDNYWHRGDKRRLGVFMWKEIQKKPGRNCEWTFEHVRGNIYYIKSHDGFYLYRPDNYWYTGDKKRIQVFIWKDHTSSMGDKYEWTLEKVA
jgi:hypothetical protein